MKRFTLPIFAAIAALAVGALAFAADSGQHSKPAACGTDPCVKISFDTGTGAAPVDTQPNGDIIGSYDGGSVLGLGPKSGLSLASVKAYTVTVKMRGGSGLDAGGSFTAGSLLAYVYDPAVGTWERAPELDTTVAAASLGRVFTGFEVFARSNYWVTYVPYGIGQPCDVYIHGQR